MQEFFVESSDEEKLYINYPMVEAFYHMKAIPDPEYWTRTATLNELKAHKYKERVNRETREGDYRKFARERRDWNTAILQNVVKGHWMQRDLPGVPSPSDDPRHWPDALKEGTPDGTGILRHQIDTISQNKYVHVLCTCVFYIVDYNARLLEMDNPQGE